MFKKLLHRILLWLCIVAGLLLALGFGAENTQRVTIHYFFGQGDTAVYFPIYFALIVGALMAFLALLPWWLSLKRENMKLKKLINHPKN